MTSIVRAVSIPREMDAYIRREGLSISRILRNTIEERMEKQKEHQKEPIMKLN